MASHQDANLILDFFAGGISGTVAKTLTAPIERVKLIIQTQDAHPKILSGEVPRYTGIVNCFARVRYEQGTGAFWRGNFTNCIRYFPTQAFNLAFKDSIKPMFPRYHPKKELWRFWATNTACGSLAAVLSLCIVYPLDYARTRLAADVGSGRKTFTGLGDCLLKTMAGPKGFFSLYNGFLVSVIGTIPYRGGQFGLNDTFLGLNPYAKDLTLMGLASKWLCAQFSVITSGFITYPLDTIRRRLQMESERVVEKRVYNGAIHCAQKIMADEGVRALFKGAGANILRGTGAAIVLVLYQEVKNKIYD